MQTETQTTLHAASVALDAAYYYMFKCQYMFTIPSSWLKPLQEYTLGSSDECALEPGGCLPSNQADRLKLSPSVGYCCPQPPSPFINITRPRKVEGSAEL